MIHQYEMVKTDENLPITFFYSPKGQRGGMYQHWHNNLEIIYLLTGEVTITINQKPIILKPGDIITINSNQIHSTNSNDLHTSAYVLQIPVTYMHQCFSNINKYSFNTYRTQTGNTDELKELLHELARVYKNGGEFKDLMIKAIIYKLLYLLLSFYSTINAEMDEQNQITLDRLKKITLFIDNNYMEPLSLSIVAAEIGITPEHLSRLFKKNMGISFLTYIDMVRLDQATKLLTTTNKSIAFISDTCGFTNYRHFAQRFKKYYNITPREFRKYHNQDL